VASTGREKYEMLLFAPEEEIIREIAREQGVSPDALLGEDPLGELRDELEETEGNDGDDEANIVLCEEEVHDCFCIYERLIDEQQERLYALIDVIEETGDLQRVNRIEEALAEVNWYLDLMYAKLKRAYYAASIHEVFPEVLEVARGDARGSARVVLLTVDASTRAWQALGRELPDAGTKIGWMLAILEQVREEVTGRFPDASTFKRPGFDDGARKAPRVKGRPATGRW
jgi:hypothetical protein